MSRQQIALIDHDEKLSDMLSVYLDMSGYELVFIRQATTAYKVVTETQPVLILMDVELPETSGWDLCRRLREKTDTPIIIISSRGEEVNVLRAFQFGVDDFVVKPFSCPELVARIGAVIRRSSRNRSSDARMESGELEIDFSRKHVVVGGQRVELTPKEYLLLATLARNANQTMPIDRLLSEVWGFQYGDDIQFVKQYIWNLRKKIEEDPKNPKHLITRRGYGYRFE